jgi:TATA-box binding protein (TBP) (component of TFIID and TFIIIB)
MQTSYSCQVVNANYRASLNKTLDLNHISTVIPNSKICNKPFQLIIKDKEGVVLLFSNGKLRTMGCIDELDATFLTYKYSTLIVPDVYPTIYFQSMTVKVTLANAINLYILKNLIPESQYEPELFPAVLVHQFKPISVNIFSTGKIMICGIKELDTISTIMHDLNNQLIAAAVLL